jgi:elongation factor 1 alpha-like protein
MKSSLESIAKNAPKSTGSSESLKKTSKSSKFRVDVHEEFLKRGTKERLNLVVVGHVDAGKSTLMGHVLLKLGEVNERTISKFKKVQ